MPKLPFPRRRDHDLVDPALLAALTAPAALDELQGEDQAVSLFRSTVSAARPSYPWRPALLASLLSTKLAAAMAVGAVGLAGASTAAYTGSLPDNLQDTAHHTIGAPAAHKHAHPSPSSTATPVGPDATGAAAFGLCTAFNKVRDHGKAEEKSIAFRNLVTAAGGADKIAAYCATVPHPGETPSTEPSHPTGKPTSVPPHATGKPSSLPTHPANPSETHRP